MIANPEFVAQGACKFCINKKRHHAFTTTLTPAGYRKGDWICTAAKSIYRGAILNMMLDGRSCSAFWSGCENYKAEEGSAYTDPKEIERKRRSKYRKEWRRKKGGK